MSIVVLGIDPGKTVCSLVGLDHRGAVAPRRRSRRAAVVDFVRSLPRRAVAMEACCGAHPLGRAFETAGFEARLLSPEYVRPYVKAQSEAEQRTIR